MDPYGNDASSEVDSLLPQLRAQFEQNQQMRQGNMDRITKMLNDRVPTPMEAISAMNASMQPLTTFEVARGVRRPSYLDALSAAKAASAKYNLDVMNAMNGGIEGSARDAQVLINAINAKALAGNQSASNIKDVMAASTAGMSPESQVIFSKEMLSRLSTLPPNASKLDMWNVAAATMKAMDPKAKRPAGIPEFRAYKDENGNTVTVKYNDSTNSYEILSVAPPDVKQSPVNRLVPITNKTTDAQGNTVETTSYAAVSPGREGQLPVYLGPVGAGGAAPAASGGSATVSPTGQAATTSQAMQPTNNLSTQNSSLSSTKITPPKITPETSANLATIKQSADVMKDINNALFDEKGNIKHTLVAEMNVPLFGTSVPQTEGANLRRELEIAISNYIYLKSGKAVTDQERQMWVHLFMPSLLLNQEGNKMVLKRLGEFFSGAGDFLPQWQQDKLKPQQGINAKEEEILNAAHNALLQGAPRDAVIKKLNSYGIDQSRL